MKLSSLRLPVFAFIGGSAIHLSGKYDQYLLMVLGILLIIDLVSFILSGKVTDTLNWNLFLKETLKRILLSGIIAISYILDELLNTGDMIKNSTLLFYISNEMVTIIRYGIKVGLPIPTAIEKFVEDVKNTEENKKE